MNQENFIHSNEFNDNQSQINIHHSNDHSNDHPEECHLSLEPGVGDLDDDRLTSQIPDPGIAILFDEIGYQVTNAPTLLGRCRCKKPHTLTLLSGISGYFRYGELVALMGGSGAGKSILLDLLALRKSLNDVTGTILVDGKIRTGLNTQDAAYVLQTDVTLANLTVFETLMFAARFRMPESYSDADLKGLVQSLLRELRLEEVAHSRVGSSLNRGISGGEMRRLAIAESLMTNPRMLFLDEPTSGLDSSAAYGVARLLRKLSRTRNQVIVCSIHQPSPQLFALFDKVVLLSKSSDGIGRLAYLGPTSTMAQYFADRGHPVPPDYNLADFAVELATSRLGWRAPVQPTGPLKQSTLSAVNLWQSIAAADPVLDDHDHQAAAPPDLPALWASSPEGLHLKAHLSELRPQDPAALVLAEEPVRYSSTFYHQFSTFTKRAYVDSFRDSGFFFRRIIKVHVIGFLIVTLYTQLSLDTAPDIQNMISLLFFLMLSGFLMAQVFLPVFMATRPLTSREREARLYGASAHFLGTLASSLPVEMINGMVFLTYVYWICGLRTDAAAFFTMLTIFVITSLWLDAFVMAISASSPNPEVSIAILPVLYV